MSVVNIIVKTIVKLIYGILQLFGIFGEGISKLSTKLGDNLVDLDNKLAKEFEKKNSEKATEEVPN